MTTKDDGGPAFPAQPIYGYPGGAQTMTEQGGMTLRDWFAGQALAASSVDDWSDADVAAKWMYVIADAMIEARKK